MEFSDEHIMKAIAEENSGIRALYCDTVIADMRWEDEYHAECELVVTGIDKFFVATTRGKMRRCRLKVSRCENSEFRSAKTKNPDSEKHLVAP